MITIKRFVCNMLQENCYVVSDESKECVIIDCGAFYEAERTAITRYIQTEELTPKHLLATHGHTDHNFGNNTIFDAFGLQAELGAADENLLNQLPQQTKAFYGFQLDYEIPPAGHFLAENEEIAFGHHRLKVLATPGHSRGSVTFYCQEEQAAFTGDTLFRNSIGRTDFKGGSMMQMIQSLRVLAQLPDETTVYPGHGDATTIGEELAHNPYMER